MSELSIEPQLLRSWLEAHLTLTKLVINTNQCHYLFHWSCLLLNLTFLNTHWCVEWCTMLLNCNMTLFSTMSFPVCHYCIGYTNGITTYSLLVWLWQRNFSSLPRACTRTTFCTPPSLSHSHPLPWIFINGTQWTIWTINMLLYILTMTEGHPSLFFKNLSKWH